MILCYTECMAHPHHHLHVRKRTKKEPYPHPQTFKRTIDRLVLVFGVFAPLMTMPQVWRVWVDQQADGLHIATWSVYFLNAVLFTIYGIIHKETPIIIMQGLFVVMTGMVSVGILLYG